MKQKINGKVVREFHKLDRLWIYWEKISKNLSFGDPKSIQE